MAFGRTSAKPEKSSFVGAMLRRVLRLFWVMLSGVLVVFALLAGLLMLIVIANTALRDLEITMRKTTEKEELPEPRLSGLQQAALFATAQVLPLHQPGYQMAAPGRVFRDCVDCPEMVEVPKGYFLLGSPIFEEGRYAHVFSYTPLRAQLKFANREGPRRLVRIPRALAFSRHEITYGQWRQAQEDPEWFAITGREPYFPELEADYRDDQPMTPTEWSDAKAYAAYLSAKTGYSYRLPTDAEWEYAARAGTVTRFPWGNDIGRNNTVCLNCSSIWSKREPGPVGLHPPNGFGLYDMHGNGFEWVEDCHKDDHDSGKTDGSPYVEDEECEFRTIRGGGAGVPAWQNRSAFRVGPHHYNRGHGHVIRLVRELD
ncbi:formylglycine-generating enzyme family protein [Ruegeria lacuscaerulensis]|uniref:formylglycine-generating enzyme family protein n=1 Tax=Ruegeria lacuscaerulensis TaxID=55218 RepID=UPI00147D6A08|nr:formylglycine-generating enzyme family protein [Ruegeria lacuscaerulensis]